MTNLLLTGFMATGKSTVGRLVARRLRRLFIDTDEVITLWAGKSIAELFADEGEQHFRDLEYAVAQALHGQHDLVVATGGGFLLSQRVAALLLPQSNAVCLAATAATILARAQPAQEQRPLLAGDRPHETIAQLLAAREAAYRQFFTIATDGLPAQAVAERVIAHIEENGRE